MSLEKQGLAAEYDSFAWFYNRYWGERYHEQVFPLLERAVLSKIPERARVLDLCCGAGHLSRMLIERGFSVIGIDSSSEMLKYARENNPGSEFLLGDARNFLIPHKVDAVVSTFESMNHILATEELSAVFESVYRSLEQKGRFFFDLLTEAAYLKNWMKSSSLVEKNDVCIVRGGYDEQKKTGRTEITMFRLEESWVRSDAVLAQKYHDPEVAADLLDRAGFRNITKFLTGEDFEMPGDLGLGRIFFSTVKEK